MSERWQQFTFMGWVWDVALARTITKDREPDGTLPVEPWYNMTGIMRINEEYAASDAVNTDEPVLAIILEHPTEGDMPLVIDGWHRIVRAHNDGRERIPFILLTKAQEKAVRLNGEFIKKKTRKKKAKDLTK